MADAAPSLILLPGLGADARFLYRQRAAFPDLIVPPWIEPERRETLVHYAERLAATVRGQVNGTCIVGGVSLGGMLALEMARHLNARSVLLISSCRHPSAVSGALRLGERGSRVLPDRVITFLHHAGPSILGRGGSLAPDDRLLLVRMARETPVPFLRWGGRAVLEWPGLVSPGVPVHHVHGDKDPVIPVRGVRPDKLIAGGSHVLNLSHPREVNEFIAACRIGSRA